MTTTVEAPAPPPARPRRKGRYLLAVGGCVAAIVAIIVLTVVLSENVVYFRTVSEAVQQRDELGTDRFRVAGQVVRGSVDETKRGVTFEITDGKRVLDVAHVGDPPDLFKVGAPVLVEGRFARADDASAPFASDRILIKHGSDYEPPEVDDSKVSKGSG